MAAFVRRNAGVQRVRLIQRNAGLPRARLSRFGYEMCDVAGWAAAKRRWGIPIRLAESGAETGERAPQRNLRTLACHTAGRRSRY